MAIIRYVTSIIFITSISRQKAFLTGLLGLLAILLSACLGSGGTEQVTNNSFGLGISIVSGNNQIGAPDELFEDPALVQVTDSSGAPVEGIKVTFQQVSGASVFITNSEVTSNGNGLAQTSVRSPREFDQTGVVRACVANSSACVDFEFGSDNTSENIKFMLVTENGGTETAGEAFTVEVRTVDANSEALIEYNGTLNLEWTFITQPSWAGVEPSLVPNFSTCTFVDGICDPGQTVTLTDARVPTRVFLGDGDGGFIDIFGQVIQVELGEPAQVFVTDALGGPDADAETVGDTVFTADDPDFTFYAAVTDSVGNYIEDAPNATWSSSHPTQITSNLSTLMGMSTILDFNQSIPFPSFGYLYADVSGYPQGSSGQISIDPGEPANVEVVPVDTNMTRTGGVPFAFNLEVRDANDNIVGQQFGSTGYTGTFPVTFTFSDYQSGPAVSGGAIPMIHNSGQLERTEVSKVLQIPFFAGRSQFLPERITFFDATAVNPRISLNVDASSDPELSNVSGSTVFNMVVGPPDHLMLRDGLGASANTMCEADYTTSPFFWRRLEYILDPDYRASYKEYCNGISVNAGSGNVQIYASIEDAGGNFIDNLDVTWVTTDMVNPNSRFNGQISGSNPSNLQTLAPQNATGGNPNHEWIRVQGTYNSVNYDQYFRGAILPGVLSQYQLKILRRDYQDPNEAVATGPRTLVVIPKDAQGNGLTQPFNRNLTVSISSSFNSSPDGTPPSFITPGLHPNIPFQQIIPVDDRDNVGDSTVVARFENLITPNAGDAVTVTVTDALDPSISDSINWQVIPGEIDSVEIWKDAAPPTGTNVTNVDFTMTADESTNFFAVAKDARGNNRNIESSWVTWNDSAQPFAPADSVSGILTGTLQTPFSVERPGSGKIFLRAAANNEGSGAAETGVITLEAGEPSYVQVEIPSPNVVAGVPQDVVVSIRDAKGNIVTDVNGPTNLAITILNNSLTRLNYIHNAPASGDYNFVNGEYTFSGAEAFTFFNSIETPRIQVSTTVGTPIVGQSTDIAVAADSFDHLALLSANTQVSAGEVNRYTIRVEDQYGNKLVSGLDAVKNVTFNITSSLGDEDIVDSNLVNPSLADYLPGNQKILNGDLTLGEAYVDLMTTKSGTLTVSGSTTGIVGTNTEEPLVVLPLTTISSIRYKPGEEPTTPSTTINQLLPFSVELLDAFDNVITTNNSDVVELNLIGASQSFENYTPQTAVNGEAVFSGLRYRRADSFTIQAVLQSNNSLTDDAPMVVELGSVTRTIAILPDQTFTEGTGSLATAITGTPFSGTGQVTAGDEFDVEVRAMDSSFNTVSTYTGSVSLESTDPYLEVTPASQNFVAGEATFTVKVRQQGTDHNIYATTGFTNHASTNYDVNFDTATQLVTILPNQTLLEGAPDLATAVDQIVPTQVAGVSFDAEIVAVDAYFNHVTDYSHSNIAVNMDSDAAVPTPSPQSMSGGSVTFSVQNYLATSGLTITPSTGAAPILTGQTSESYEVNPNTATQYIAVLPGQTHSPGQAPGDYASAVLGTPTDQDTDSGFSVNLFAVDNYFNTRGDHASAVSIATPDDPNDVEPAASNFAAGAVTFTINPVRAQDNQDLTITSGLAANTPATYNVKPGAPSQLIAVFTDYQTLDEGSLTLAGAVADQSVQDRESGESVSVRVYATDNKFNVVDDDSTSVSITPSIPNHAVTPTNQSLTNGQADFAVETFLVGTGYDMLPSGGSYSQNRTTDYNVTLGSGKRLLLVLPNQTFSPGQATAADAASGTPFRQTQGSDFPFIARVYSTDDYFNHRSADTDTVTITPSLASTISGGASQAMVGGQADFTLYHTANSNAQNIQATASGFTSGTSKNYDVLANLVNPTLALSDPTTSDTSYIRQNSVATSIGSDGTTSRWCVSETQSTRPSSGTNDRGTCNGGAGSDDGWFTSRPSTVPTTSSQGSKTLYVWTSDEAFNVSVGNVSDAITLDSVKPNDPTNLTLQDQSSFSNDYTNAATVDLDITLSGDTTEWCLIEQPLVNPAPSVPDFDSGCWSAKPGVFPTPITLASTGTRSIYVFAKDIAENVSNTYATASITYDNTAPIFPAGDDIIGVRGGTDTVADEWLGTTLAPTVEWQAATDETLDHYILTIKQGGTPVCGGPTTVTGTSHTFGSCLVDGQTYTIELEAFDSAEQSTVADNNGFSFTVDTVRPSTFTVTGLSGGSDSTPDAFLTNALTAPRLDWVDATGETGYNVFIVNDAETVTECGVDQAAADATSYQSFSGCNLADNTDYKLRIVAFDQAGNEREATNSPFSFRTSEGVDHFDIDLLPASNPTAGANFSVQITARRANNEVVTSYTGVKNINWTTNAGNGTDVCDTASNMNPEFPSATQNFSSGVVSNAGNIKLKRAQTGRTITVTEQDTGYNASGTTATFDVIAASANCIRLEDQAGGAGSPLSTQAVGIDTVVTIHAASYDIYGNYLSDESVAWSGTDAIENRPYPATGSSTTVVTTKEGTGQLIATGTSTESLNFNVSSGNSVLSSATTDIDSNSHLANNSVNAVYQWDISSDNSSAWITSGTQSWYSEGLSANRGDRDDFPEQVLLVAHNSGLDIIDQFTNNLYMRFQSGSDYAIDSDLGNPVDVSALNGKIFVSMDDGSSTGGLIIIDLENDQVYQTNAIAREVSGNNIASRNSAGVWSTDTTYPLLGSSRMNKISSKRVSGQDYLAIGHNDRVEVLDLTSPTGLFTDTTANNVFAVALTSGGDLYYGEDSVGLHRATLPLAASFAPARTYNTASNAELASTIIQDISVAEGTSSADAGANTVLVASNMGVTSIQEHGTASSSTSKNYASLGSGANAFAGALRLSGSNGYVSLNDGGGLTDTISVEMWFRPQGNPAGQVLFEKGSGVDGAISLEFDGSGYLTFTVQHNSMNYSVSSSTNTWATGEWKHVAAVLDPSGIALWIDGADQDVNTSMNFASPVFSLSSATATVGAAAASGYFNGFIDELRVSSNVRYSTASFTVPNSAFFNDGSTEHLLHFNEASGTTANYSDSGAQVNGSISGDAFFTTPLYAGSSDQIFNIDSVVGGGRVNLQLVTPSGWMDLMDLQSTSPYEQSADTGVSPLDVKIYQVDSATNNDSILGLDGAGVQLRRR